MRNFCLCFVVMAVCGMAHGQRFADGFEAVLPDSLSFTALEFADLNNDGFLDVVLLATEANNNDNLFLMVNDAGTKLNHKSTLGIGTGYSAHCLADLDGDNQVDIIISGRDQGVDVTRAFLNKGDFRFEPQQLAGLRANLIRAADLNSDGVSEVLMSGERGGGPFFTILAATSTGWETVHDSLRINAAAAEVFDFDADQDNDLLISGRDDMAKIVTNTYLNDGDFRFNMHDLTPALYGIATRGDINHDGKFDLLLAGVNAEDTRVLKILQGSSSGFQGRDSLIGFHARALTAADFDSDGVCDVHILGVQANGDTLNVIAGSGSYDTLEHRGVVQQRPGDFDRDGDLDMLQLRRTSSGTLVTVVENNAPAKNLAPVMSPLAVAARIFDRIFIAWEIASDDHTPMNSLTYDVTVMTTGITMPGDFDQINGRRLLVSHGNNLTSRSLFLRNTDTSPFHFSIQSVDNAFHAGPGGICRGSGGSPDDCVEVTYDEVQACKNENVVLTAQTDAEWYSFREGFLGKMNALPVTVSQADTVLSIESREPGCALISVYTLHVPGVLEKQLDSVLFLCEGQSLRLGVDAHWSQVQWTSAQKGMLSIQDSIVFNFTVPDTLTVVTSDGLGCSVELAMILKMSKPDVHALPEAYQILKGTSVQLTATGASSYEWTPPTGLDNPLSAQPMATPSQTIQYTVSAVDSLGCRATDTVTVIVEQTAFIPNLFTPNNDGSNDLLKIYGLGDVHNFSFTIFNREGSTVFHTENVDEAVRTGWNGTYHGAELPPGVYYWNVKGETDSGRRLRLNGKDSGSIVLLR